MVEIDDFRDEIKGLTKEELTEIQRAIRLEKQAKYEKKGLNLYGYISEEEKKYSPIVMEWLLGKEANKTVYGVTSTSVKLVVEVVRENGEHIPLVLDWLYDKEMISEKTIYNLITMAVKLVIQSTLDEIRKSGQKPKTH